MLIVRKQLKILILHWLILLTKTSTFYELLVISLQMNGQLIASVRRKHLTMIQEAGKRFLIKGLQKIHRHGECSICRYVMSLWITEFANVLGKTQDNDLLNDMMAGQRQIRNLRLNSTTIFKSTQKQNFFESESALITQCRDSFQLMMDSDNCLSTPVNYQLKTLETFAFELKFNE